ncbi:hypothetical protein JCM11641_004625, partial [Rhodosporidiobolus odoratus]
SSSSSSPSSLRPVPIARSGLPDPVYIHDPTGTLTLLPMNSTISDPFTVERWNKEREHEDAYAVMYAAAEHDGLDDFFRAPWYKRTQNRVRKLAEQVKKPKGTWIKATLLISDPVLQTRPGVLPPRRLASASSNLVRPSPSFQSPHQRRGRYTAPNYPRPKALPATHAAVISQADPSRPSLPSSESSLSAVFSTSSSSTALTASSSVSSVDADKVGMAF